MAWVNGDQIGVNFLERSNKKRNAPTKTSTRR
jgi:hypothetical protein